MTTRFSEAFEIVGASDDKVVQRYTSFLNWKKDGFISAIDCTNLDRLVEYCCNNFGTDDEVELMFNLNSSRLPWFKHFKVDVDALADKLEEDLTIGSTSDDKVKDVILDDLSEYLVKRNDVYTKYYELDNLDTLCTLVLHYRVANDWYVLMVTPALSQRWNRLYSKFRPVCEGRHINELPIYNSKMTYWGIDDGQTFVDGTVDDNEEVYSTLLIAVIPGRPILDDEVPFVMLNDHHGAPDAETLTLSLIDMLDDRAVMTDSSLFREIGSVLINVSNGSVPYALHRWRRRFAQWAVDGVFHFDSANASGQSVVDKVNDDGQEQMTLLDMRDHLNKSTSRGTWKVMYMRLLQQSPQKAYDWKRRWMKETYVKSPERHHEASLLLYKISFERYVYASERGRWYYYDKNIWTIDCQDSDIKGEVPTLFASAIEQLIADLVPSTNAIEEVVEYFDDVKMSLISLRSKLSTVTYIGNIIKAATTSRIFANKNFEGLLDADANALNTPSCIVRFNAGKFDVSPSNGEDYVSKTTNVHYNTNLCWDSESVKMAMDWIQKLFPDQSMRHEVLKILSYLLQGGNKYKKFFILSGPKDTGKSTFKRFIEKILSKCDKTGYSRDVPLSVITKDQKAGAASPEIVQCVNAKTAWFSEPDGTATLNNGFIKSITGGDSFFARGLYESGRNIEPNFKLLMVCNEIPLLKDFDRYALERMIIIPFETVFVTNAPEDEEAQRISRRYPLNPDFYKQNDLICEGLLWIMVQYSEHLEREGIVHENSIDMYERYQAYVKVNNKFYSFIDDMIIESTDSLLPVSQVVSEYKNWFKRETRRIIAASDEHIINELNLILGTPIEYDSGTIAEYWRGYKLRFGDHQVGL